MKIPTDLNAGTGANSPQGSAAPVDKFSFTEEQERRIREAFEKVLDECSAPAYDLGQLNRFSEEEETFIQREVERMLYEPQLPNGGWKERHMIERLRELAQDTEWEGHKRAFHAAEVWSKVLADNPHNPGRYYARRPLTPRADKETYHWLLALKEASRTGHYPEREWFAQMLLDGLPEPVSNFRLDCLFLLRRSDGVVNRLVRLRNVLGEVSRGNHQGGSDVLDAEAFASPEKFRRWCLARGNFAWAGNQVDLQKLHEDLTHSEAWRVINQVDCCGWHRVPGKTEESEPSKILNGIWFCDDCAFANGKELQADEDGIYWYQGEGYYLSRRGRESDYAQGRPKPEVKLEL